MFNAEDVMPRTLLVDDEGQSLTGSCSLCRRTVDNHDPGHRVSAVMQGGRGVECVRRGDIPPERGGPL